MMRYKFVAKLSWNHLYGVYPTVSRFRILSVEHPLDNRGPLQSTHEECVRLRTVDFHQLKQILFACLIRGVILERP